MANIWPDMVNITTKIIFNKYIFLSITISITVAITPANILDELDDLIPFVQFKKREKHPWRSVTFSKVAGLK